MDHAARRATPVGLVLWLVGGCYHGREAPDGFHGNEDGGSESASEEGGSDDDGAPPNAECASPMAEASPMRRLTRIEYLATVADLFGPTADLSGLEATLPADGVMRTFTNNADLPMGLAAAEAYMQAAESVSIHALPLLDACTDERACAEAFIRSFGRRAYRRPLDDAEIARLLEVYDASLGSHDDAVRSVVEAMLQSPHFLYHVDHGSDEGPEGMRFVEPWSLASRLSYFLWQTMPDEELFAAAEDGSLLEVETVEAQARRMLDDPRAKATLAGFYREWLGYADAADESKNLEGWSPELGAEMVEATARWLDALVWEDEGTLTDLLTDPSAFANASLASIYRIDGLEGDALRRVDLDPSQRSGILTSPSILATYAYAERTSPIHRGKFVRERLLCGPGLSPPPDVELELPDVSNACFASPHGGGAANMHCPQPMTRDHHLALVENSFCGGCHQMMDLIGIGFENYDAMGSFRTHEQGQLIDARGYVVGTDLQGTFDGVPDLGRRLAQSEDVGECFVRQLGSFATGRFLDDDDDCSVEAIAAALDEADGRLDEALVLIVTSDAFRLQPEVETDCEGGQ